MSIIPLSTDQNMVRSRESLQCPWNRRTSPKSLLIGGFKAPTQPTGPWAPRPHTTLRKRGAAPRVSCSMRVPQAASGLDRHAHLLSFSHLQMHADLLWSGPSTALKPCMSHSSGSDPGRPTDKPRSERYKLGIADTGPQSAQAIRGEGRGEGAAAWEAVQAQRVVRARQETEPLRKKSPQARFKRIAAGTRHPEVAPRPRASMVSRADTLEDFRVAAQGDED
jgi:hypothetical protein